LTIAQLMHALSIDPHLMGLADVAQMQAMMQREILDRVAANRGWLAAELMRMPLCELTKIIGAISGKQPSEQHLASALAAYIGHEISAVRTY
jgi:hypothetical protein